MTDIALAWSPDRFAADLLLGAGQLVSDDGLRTAILISLFSDARAPEEAVLPEDGADRRGWWGDDFAADGSAAGSQNATGRNAIGSTLWLLHRSKITPATLQRAREAAFEALGWLVRDGIASAVDVEVEAPIVDGMRHRLAIGVTLDRPQGPGRQRHDFTWLASVDASTGELVA